MKFPFTLPGKIYDVLKWIVIIVLPASATLYAHLAETWGFPYADQISRTIGDINTFFGIILCISFVGYKKGIEDESVQ